jgi:hypothetical protein
MSVRVTAACRVAYNFQVIDLDEGQVIPDGELADHLAATGAPVEPVDEPADPSTPPSTDPPVPPAANATKTAWVEHAVAQGADAAAAVAMTKAALIEAHGTTTE